MVESRVSSGSRREESQGSPLSIFEAEGPHVDGFNEGVRVHIQGEGGSYISSGVVWLKRYQDLALLGDYWWREATSMGHAFSGHFG